MNPKLGLTRNVIKRNYALITPDGHVPSAFPGWTNCTPYVLISAALGARLSQYLIAMDTNSAGVDETGNDEWFFYIVGGKITVNKVALAEGGFAFLPPGTKYDVRGAAKDSRAVDFSQNLRAAGRAKAAGIFHRQRTRHGRSAISWRSARAFENVDSRQPGGGHGGEHFYLRSGSDVAIR